MNPALTCDYCGTGAQKLRARISRGLANIVRPNSIDMTPKTLRIISQKNNKTLDECCDISEPVRQINELIKQAVTHGDTKARFTLIYANLSNREREHVKRYYEDQKFEIVERWLVSPDEVRETNLYATSSLFTENVYIFVCW